MSESGNTKLYMSNLSFEATEEHILGFFKGHGEVTDIKIVTDRYTGRPRGFAFVEMATATQAERAKKSLDGQQFLGRDISVDWAKSREPTLVASYRGGDYELATSPVQPTRKEKNPRPALAKSTNSVQ